MKNKHIMMKLIVTALIIFFLLVNSTSIIYADANDPNFAGNAAYWADQAASRSDSFFDAFINIRRYAKKGRSSAC